MNKKRRTQGFNGFGLVRTKTYIATREPKVVFEKIKTFYGDHLHGSNGTIKINTNEGNTCTVVNEFVLKEKRRQFFSYVMHGITALLAIILLSFIMNAPFNH
jgi:hypothetical protein|tara:strand:+ start:22 stop:327 length:306 start_codon:yes stop_codon:yes gene_type:complete